MKFYIPIIYDREDNMSTVYFQDGNKLYTEEDKETIEAEGKKIEGWEEVECDEKILKDNSKVYVITQGIDGVGNGGTSVYDHTIHSQEEMEEILKEYNSKPHPNEGLEEWEYESPLFLEKNTIDIFELGAEIGMEVKEQTLPTGKVAKSLLWDQENLLKAVNVVKHLSEEGKPVRITGVAPAWLVSALTHTVHPCPVCVYVPPIGKDVDIPQLAHGEANPEGEVAFKITEKGDAVLVEYNMDLPEGITTYDENNLSKVVVPEIAQGKAVYISGKGPNYLTVAIAEAYAHTNSSVSLFQPSIGYTCSITHSRSKRLGDLTKDPLGMEKIKEQLAAKKENRDAETKEGPAID